MKWRYSLGWKLPHKPCPGPLELVSVVVEAGQAAPEEVMSRWVAGSGYAVCVDFLGQKQIQRWSDERKAAVRRRRKVRTYGMAGSRAPRSRADSTWLIACIAA